TALPARPGSARGRRPRHVGHRAGPLPPDAAPGDGQHGALRERGAPRGKPAVRDRIRLSLLLAAGFLPACAGRAPAAGPPAVPVMTAVAAQKDVPVRVQAIETARLQLGYCTIRSPIEGRTGSLLLHQGNLVKAIDGGPLVVVNRVDPVYVSFAVPEKRLSEIEHAMASGRLVVEALLPGDDAPPIPGRLTFLDNAVDRSTGTIRLKGTFPNPGRRL